MTEHPCFGCCMWILVIFLILLINDGGWSFSIDAIMNIFKGIGLLCLVLCLFAGLFAGLTGTTTVVEVDGREYAVHHDTPIDGREITIHSYERL